MKKFIILGLVVLFVFLSAQGLYKVKTPAKFDKWVKIGGDFIPIWDGRSNLGHSSYWFDSSFVEHGWFNYIQIDSTVQIRETQTIDLATAGVDTALYLKHYGARTGGYGIVIDMDTSENTAANVKGIDFGGSNAFNNYQDYFLYLNSSNSIDGGGMWKGSYFNTGSMFYFGTNVIGDLLHSSSQNIQISWIATKKGDVIFRDGNLDVANINFVQIQDSAGTAMLNIPNVGIRGHLHFAGNCLVDTVPGVAGVTDNSFVFLTWKGTAAPTSPLAWKYLGVDSIAVYCAIADSTTGRVSGYTWFRIE